MLTLAKPGRLDWRDDLQGGGRRASLSQSRVGDSPRLGRGPARMVRLDELITTKRNLDLATLLSEESTFYGDLFAHVVQWQDKLYLEDGLHRACGQPFSNVQPCMPACWCLTDLAIPLTSGPKTR